MALSQFAPPTREWFEQNFDAPTPVQAQAWASIAAGKHTLVSAPTGSGKTLAAFLWGIDALARRTEPTEGTRIVYVSPLKALVADIARNLHAPLIGIDNLARTRGESPAAISVAMRTGDTTPQQRREYLRSPADILVTTPESLFLLLTSQGRQGLTHVDTVIVDEIHALAGTKRGAHLAVTLERLEEVCGREFLRIGLSATASPLERVGEFLAGQRPVNIVAPPSHKDWDLQIQVPVPDMTELPRDAEDPLATPSIWTFVEDRLYAEAARHRSTLIFTNSRALTERLTARLNEIHAAQTDAEEPFAKAHHGSISREHRSVVEAELKAGTLRAVVATSSLELGIDMGAIDLVLHVESPPSVAAGLQRVGRAGHSVGATSKAIIYPKYPGDLLQAHIVVDRMRQGAIEETTIPKFPLDVAAQQVVAMASQGDVGFDHALELLRRTAPFRGLSADLFASVCDMLAGRYPSDDFADLRPSLIWDRLTNTLKARPHAQRLAVTSGGTIPDRGQFGVFVAGDGPGRRVGELDEEMVYESRVGDVITLGTSSWRILEITHDQVLVVPAPGLPARLPFWKADSLSRPAAVGQALGEFLARYTPERTPAALAESGLDAWAVDNLCRYLNDQRDAVGSLNTHKVLLVERFRDELGDWRVVVHSPWGYAVHAPWALLVADELQTRWGCDVDVVAADDGLVLRVPEFLGADDWSDDLDAALHVDPLDLRNRVAALLSGSAVFASRFREVCARSLLLPAQRPGKRQPLWLQRRRSAQLLEAVAGYPDFPMVLEAVREVLFDVFDVVALESLLNDLQGGTTRLRHVASETPSPFAKTLLFGYVAHFLYEGDTPLAERRAAALSLDSTLLAQLMGADAAPLVDLLDPTAIEEVRQQLQFLLPSRHARHAEDLTDLLRVLGPLTLEQLALRSSEDPTPWLADLERDRRVYQAAGRYISADDVDRMRDALGIQPPPGFATAEPQSSTDALVGLVRRFARTNIAFTVDDVATALGCAPERATQALEDLGRRGDVVAGQFTSAAAHQWIHKDVLTQLRRRSLAILRHEVEAIPPERFAAFLPWWQGVGGDRRGMDGLWETVEQLAGAPIAASLLHTSVLPARVKDFEPWMLEQLFVQGEVLWQAHEALGTKDAWISLHIHDTAALTRRVSSTELSEQAALIRDYLSRGGSFRADEIARALDLPSASDGLWELALAGEATADTLQVITMRQGKTIAPTRPARPGRGRSRRTPLMGGRWTLLPSPATAEERALAVADQLVDRYGICTRDAVRHEDYPGGFSGLYPVLTRAEEAGRFRRGYFVEGLGMAQFASKSAIDDVRGDDVVDEVTVLAATDPAQPWGALLPWPALPDGARPARRVGAIVISHQGRLLAYGEARTTSLWFATDVDDERQRALEALVQAADAGRIDPPRIKRIDGVDALTSPLQQLAIDAGFVLTPQGLRRRGAPHARR